MELMGAKPNAWEKFKYWLQQRKDRIRQERAADGDGEIFEYEWDSSPDLLMIMMKIVLCACSAGLIIALAIRLASGIYSVGGLVNWLAMIMASICASGGSCSVPLLLSSITVAILIIVAATMLILIPFQIILPDRRQADVHDHLQLLSQKLDGLYLHLKVEQHPEAREKLQAAQDRRKAGLARAIVAAALFATVALIAITGLH